MVTMLRYYNRDKALRVTQDIWYRTRGVCVGSQRSTYSRARGEGAPDWDSSLRQLIGPHRKTKGATETLQDPTPLTSGYPHQDTAKTARFIYPRESGTSNFIQVQRGR